MTSAHLHISLPDELKMFVDQRVKTRGYGSLSEYLRDLLRKDELEAAKDKLRGFLLRGLESESTSSWAKVKTGLEQKIRQSRTQLAS